jgi:HTH-type transcriptional regulator/antitoxin HipB
MPRIPSSTDIASPGAPTSIAFTSVGDLGAFVRRVRKDRRITQQQLADLSGVGRRFLRELESGKPTLEIGRVLMVTAALGIDLTGRTR